MRKFKNKLLVTALGLQILLIGPVIAESVTGIGSEEISQNQASLILDSQHTQEPPGIEPQAMVASYYASYFHGRKTASGETFDQYAMTCAHKSLPFDTRLIISNPKNGKSIQVRVNDRGPFRNGRDLDLSYAAAKEIGLIRPGVAEVEVYVLHHENDDHKEDLAIN